jgi:hypothetical protein
VTRIRPVKNQLELARILEWTGMNGGAGAGTYRRCKPTGMMPRDRALKPSGFELLPESLQGGESFVRYFVTA